MRRAAILGPLLMILGSCNPYDLTLHDRFAQSSFNSDVDILWVVDNSQSMARVQEEVRDNFASFINQFANIGDEDGTELDYDDLSDGTVAWAEFLQNQERFLNYRMGVITTDLFRDTVPGSSTNGDYGNLRSLSPVGETVTCGPGHSPAVITPRSEDPVDDFTDLVDVGVAGSGDERGLNAVALALCKGQPDSFWVNLASRPDDDPVKLVCSAVPASDRQCNWVGEGDDREPFFREDAATVVIVVSDEGDDTHRNEQLPPPDWVSQCELEHNQDPLFGGCDCQLSWWLDFFDAMDRLVVFANIGPTYQDIGTPTAWCDGTEITLPGACNPFGNSICSIDFYQQAACMTQGLFTPIETRTEEDPTCELAEFQQALTDIGALISNLSRGWVLTAVPDPSTITVIKNDDHVVPNIDDEDGTLGGWRYVPSQRAIAFSGDEIPNYEDTIDIYYLPQHDRTDNVGRPLPY